MNCGARVFLVPWIVVVCIHIYCSAAGAAERCREPAGRLVSVQGEAQVLKSGLATWDPVPTDLSLCPGDTLRVGTHGRVAVVLANESILRIDQNSTLTFGDFSTGTASLVKLLKGILHIFSHRPRSLDIATPYVNGAVEGTEFLVQANPENTVIIVFEGKVRAVNSQGQLDVSTGQAIVAEKGMAPQYMTVVRPRDAVHWTLYYPFIIDRPAVADESDNDPLMQAVDNLAVGRVAEARALIAGILAKDQASSEALALLAIIEVVQNNTEQALDLALRAIEINPRSAAAGLALSYAQQARFDIPGALATLEKAKEFNPESTEILARLAELQLSVGELAKAERSARQAATLNPDVGRIQTVLGFAHLTRIETDKAREAFTNAISLDPALPLARLGLGLALIRDGDLQAGRAEIEIAAALDPGNALIRSYLGKAYYEEKRDGQSRRQYEIAKSLDPADPTPWFYDALRKQSVNRPVEALRDLQRSIELNDNRAVYRSRLLLDDDLATRSASLGRIYSDLGFQQLALVEGWKSVNIDPANYSAHRFLADSYSVLPRHEIARVSELLQSQLLQPLSITPVQPQMAESSLFILDGAGPAEASFNEYTPLFVRNRLALQTSGVAGGNEILGDEVVQSGVWDRFSYSLGQFHYQTEGFRENNDQDQDIQNAYLQYRVSTDTSVLVEVRNSERDTGDLEMLFDPQWFFSDQEQETNRKTGRIGFHHNFSPVSALLGVVTVQDLEERFETGFAGGVLRLFEQTDGYLAEMQHQFRSAVFDVTSGTGLFAAENTQNIEMIIDPSGPSDSSPGDSSDITHGNAYIYSQIDLLQNLMLTIGMSYDAFDDEQSEKDQFNPKLGLAWNPLPKTTFRTAVFRVLTRSLVSDQTIEPTQVAGFNQFYDDAAGVGNWIYGGAVDQGFSENLFGGVELAARRQDVPYESFDLQNLSALPEHREADWQENLARVYLYWAPRLWLSTSIEYFLEDFDRDDEFVGTENFQTLETNRLRLGGSLFHGSGMFLRLYATYADQRGDFFDPFTLAAMQDDDQFLVVDCSIGYRLPKRRGIVSLEARNLFDQEIRFQDTDPGNPRIAPDQLLLLRVTLAF
jgi:tetratricopeptide (TPR) repeat protein